MLPSASIEHLEQENAWLAATVSKLAGQLQSALDRATQLQRQLDWFKRQLFGRKSKECLCPQPAAACRHPCLVPDEGPQPVPADGLGQQAEVLAREYRL